METHNALVQGNDGTSMNTAGSSSRLARRTIDNAVFNTLSWAVPAILSFLILPFIVRSLGPDAYGILTLVLTVIGYFAFLDLGLGTAVVKYVAEYSSGGDRETMNQLIGTIFLVLLVLGGVGACVLMLIAQPLAASVLKVPPHLVRAAYISFCIGSPGFFFTVLLSFLSAIPNGLNRYDVTSMMSVGMGVLTTLGTALILWFGFSLLQVVSFNVVVSIVSIAAYVVIVKRLMPGVSLRPRLCMPMLRRVLGFGLYSVLSRIAYVANYQGDRLFTGAILGVSSVTHYVVPFSLADRVSSITVRIGSVIFPAISELHGQKRHDEIVRLYLVSSRVILALSTAVCLPLGVFGNRLVALWMGSDFGLRTVGIVELVTLGLYMTSLTNVPSFVVDGLGRPRISGISASCTTILHLSLIIPLAKVLGLIGIATAFLVSTAVVGPVFVYYVNRNVIMIPQLRMLKEAYAKPLAAGVVSVVPVCLVSQSHVHSVFVLLALMGSTSLLYVVVAYAIGVFPSEAQRYVQGVVGGLLRRSVRLIRR